MSTGGEHLRDVGHVSRREHAIEHRAREAVDLHDDQPPPDSLRAATATKSADQTIERSLQKEKEIVQGMVSNARARSAHLLVFVSRADIARPHREYEKPAVRSSRVRCAAPAEDDIDQRGGVRPATANVTGPDKVRGSTDHVQMMTEAARGKAMRLPSNGLIRLLIHVEDMAEVFARVLLAEASRHHLYNSGGIPVSLGEPADIVRGSSIPRCDLLAFLRRLARGHRGHALHVTLDRRDRALMMATRWRA